MRASTHVATAAAIAIAATITPIIATAADIAIACIACIAYGRTCVCALVELPCSFLERPRVLVKMPRALIDHAQRLIASNPAAGYDATSR